jgi:hypothetical protein
MNIILTLDCLVINPNKLIQINIFDKDILLHSYNDLTEGPLLINCSISWPTVITIALKNKHNADAIVLRNLSINNFAIQQHLLEKLFVCCEEGSSEEKNAIYWGFNGTVKIYFTEKNPIRWMLAMKNEFKLDRLT